MGLANTLPVFLDDFAGYNKRQVRLINLIVRTARRAFESKAKQKQKTEPVIEKISKRKYNRVLDLKDYLYGKSFSMSFILNPVGFVKDGEYPLFETDKNINFIHINGSNSETKPDKSLSGLGYLKVSYVTSTNPVVMFVCTTDEWPEDEQHEKVKYSAFVSGTIK